MAINPGVVINNGSAFVYDLSGSQTASYNISGSGSLTTLGSNVLTLSGSNTYTRGTTVSAGVLTFAKTAAEPSSGTATVAAGATLGLGVGTSGAYFTSANVNSLFAGTLPNVNMNPASNVGIDTTAGNFTYATSVAGFLHVRPDEARGQHAHRDRFQRLHGHDNPHRGHREPGRGRKRRHLRAAGQIGGRNPARSFSTAVACNTRRPTSTTIPAASARRPTRPTTSIPTARA